jgi:hypothetical protein
MTTMVNLSDEEIAELQAATKQSDIGEALKTALHEYVRYIQRQELMTLSGRVEMQENWQELEEAELKAANELRRPGPY